MDMGSDEISLNFENNIFGDVNTLKLSFSYTFNLPRTLTNDAIFKQSYDPASGCAELRKKYKCDYERNGVILFSGSLYVTEVNERGYNCVLLWGLDALKTMSTEKLKIWQLPQGTAHQNDTIRLSHAPTYNNTVDFLGGPFYGFARYFSGISAEVSRLMEKPAVLPCVNVKYIFELIHERYKVCVQFPDSRQNLINKMVIALTDSRVWRDGMPTPRGAFRMDKQFSAQYGYQVEFIPTAWGNGTIYQRHAVDTDRYYYTTTQNITINNLHIELTNNVQFDLDNNVFGYHIAEYDSARGLWVIKINASNLEFSAGEDFALTLKPHESEDLPPHNWLQGLQLIAYNFDIKADGKGVKSGSNYFIPANLPDITAMDFIKEICVFLGVTPTSIEAGAGGSNVIVCQSLDEILNKEPALIDALDIDSIVPHYKEMARKNIYKFKTDATHQTNDFAASLDMDDETAEAEKAAFTSSFSALMGQNTIPLFASNNEITAEKLSVTDNSVNCVLCVLDTAQTIATLTQSGLTFTTLLAYYYGALAEILRNPLIITVTAKLTPSQEMQLNAARCYYPALLCDYFIPLKVETKDNFYKMELIKAPRGITPTPPPPETLTITDFLQYFVNCWIGEAYGVKRYEHSGPYNTGVVIPLGIAQSIKIKTTQYHTLDYALLSSVENMEFPNPPLFADGYTDVLTAPANQETTITRTANANYLYFNRKYDAGYQLPEYIKLIEAQ